MYIQNYEYYLRVKGTDEILRARPFGINDVEQVVKFAKKITMSPDNYKRLLGIGCTEEFSKTGALLETTEEEIAEVARDDRYFKLGIWDRADRLVAFMIVQLEDFDDFLVHSEDFSFRSGFEHNWDFWSSIKRLGGMTYKGDIGVSHDINFPKMFSILFYLGMSEMIKLGKTHCVTEVFRLTACTDCDGRHLLDITNERSFNAQTIAAAAYYVADYRLKQKNIADGVVVEYNAKILEYDFAKTVAKCKDVLLASDIEIKTY